MPLSNIDHITIFLIVISVVGTIGNLIVAFVYWKKKDKQTSTFFILLLSFIDLTVCCILVPLTIYMEKIVFETNSLILCKAFFFLTTTTVPSSSLLMTAISIDRYFCICQANKNVLTLARTKTIGIILLVFSVFLGVIPALCSVLSLQQNDYNSTLTNNQTSLENYETTSMVMEIDNKTDNLTYQCVVNHDSSSDFGFLIMPFKFFYDFVFIASVITITSLYVLIYKEIYTRRKAKRDRRRELMNNKFLNGGGGGGAQPLDVHDDDNCACYKVFFCFTSEPIKNEEIDLNVDVKEDKNISPLLKKNCKPDDIKLKFDLNNLQENNNLDENTKTANNYEQIKQQASIKKNKKNTGGSIRQSLRRRSVSYGKHSISTKDIRTAFMLFVVSFLFIIFYLPSLTATYLSMFRLTLNPNLYITYLYFSNSAINPIIYCFLNPNFRNDLIKLFFKRCFLFQKCSKNVF